MNILDLDPAAFPSASIAKRAKWAPVYLEPVPGSGERLTIGVAVVNSNEFHVERANGLRKLNCLYGAQADVVKFAATASLDALIDDLTQRGEAALTDPRPAFASITFGPLTEGTGASLQDIARAWLFTSSSLVNEESGDERFGFVPASEQNQTELATVGEGNRLHALIFRYVTQRRPGLDKCFDRKIREAGTRLPRTKASEVQIDFSGTRLVANFGMIRAKGASRSVGTIKQRLWDLKVEREKEADHFIPRHAEYEMLVQHPAPDDPQVTVRQQKHILEALDDLEEQADRTRIRLRPMISVHMMAEHILNKEAA
ncbi:MAG TPA: hypothetical protein VEY95_06820 [Azospirillaceae bacterium]|nr:hypothetical protein [Azospirillaceae bacterium]